MRGPLELRFPRDSAGDTSRRPVKYLADDTMARWSSGKDTRLSSGVNVGSNPTRATVGTPDFRGESLAALALHGRTGGLAENRAEGLTKPESVVNALAAKVARKRSE